jgi:hypothetical protein
MMFEKHIGPRFTFTNRNSHHQSVAQMCFRSGGVHAPLLSNIMRAPGPHVVKKNNVAKQCVP